MLQVILFSFVAFAVGLAFCFAGYRFFRFLLPIWAFFTGLVFGVNLITATTGSSLLSSALGLVVGLFIGGVLAVIAYLVYSIAVILFGITFGYALGAGFMLMLGFSDGLLTIMVGVVVAVGFAIMFAAWRFPRLLIVATTGLGGAMAVITGLLMLFGQIPDVGNPYGITSVIVANSFLWTVIWLSLGAFGIATQFALEKEIEMMEPYEYEALVLADNS